MGGKPVSRGTRVPVQVEGYHHQDMVNELLSSLH
ncbi:MAG: DUF433 domain-containing protein [Elusimicrobia bacterium]|nr:DUF433 domain-containing protein [Elusimicrobiota bacterium]MBU2615235.1 DUF433 domain-containing protein [Elusimicrobiota bacterium]